MSIADLTMRSIPAWPWPHPSLILEADDDKSRSVEREDLLLLMSMSMYSVLRTDGHLLRREVQRLRDRGVDRTGRVHDQSTTEVQSDFITQPPRHHGRLFSHTRRISLQGLHSKKQFSHCFFLAAAEG